MNKFFILFLIVFSGNKLFAQDNFDYNFIEKKTYEYYLSKQWDSLIYIGNIGIQNNIDYFYLRSRIGYSYFEKNNYVKASEHFEKAMKFNGSDNFVIENLYNSYINLGFEGEANNLLRSYSQYFSDKTTPKTISEAYIEYGKTNNNNNENNKLNDIKNNINWAESNTTNNIEYLGAGIKYSINKNIIMSTSYGKLNIDNTRQIVIGNEILNEN
jgi:tetratricopeptide (TPR) repeat protein